MRLATASVAVLLVLPSLAPAQRLVLYPAGPLATHPVNPGRGYRDLVVGTVALVNGGSAAVDVDRVEVEAREGTTPLTSARVAGADLVQVTAEQVGMRAAGATVIAELGFPLAELGAPAGFANQRPIPPGAALLVPTVYLAVRGRPTEVRVRAALRGADGAERSVELVIPVVNDPSPTEYRMPLDGAWLLRSVPGLTSHHRFNPQTEFAVDFWKVDSAGGLYRGAGRSPEDYHGFGAVVRAAATGVVETVENGATQDWNERLRRDHETAEQYRRRIFQYNVRTITADTRRALIGNHVVIRHANGEWSTYGHLKTGSVLVAPGDSVRAGQAIGAVGDTGDSHLAHLHFQLNAGPDPLKARSRPLVLRGLVPDDPDLGRFVRPAN